jgi:membrane protein
MSANSRSVWDSIFHRDEGAGRIPVWLRPYVRFAYLVYQEFSRNRCWEKASALGFQTVFSLIPAFALALFFFRVFGDFSGVGREVEQFLFRRLNIDRIQLKSSGPDLPSGPALIDPAAAPPLNPAEPKDALDHKTMPDVPPTTPDQPGVRLPPPDVPTLSLDREVQELVDSVYQKLSTGGLNIVSFAWLVVAAIQLALTLERNMNEVWGSVAQWRLLRRFAVYWSVLTLGPLLIGLSIYGAKRLGVTSSIQELLVSTLGPLVTLYLIYQWMPSAVVHPLTALAGAFTAAVFLQLASWLFGAYLENAVGYEKLYGNLGLIPLFLFWLWIIWVMVLTGAEVAYTLQNLDRLTAEERRRRGAPFIQPALIALGLVLHAARAFRSGKGPVSADELAESSGLPDKLWLRVVALLQERGILVETDGARYVPGRPLESLEVSEILSLVDESLIARPDELFHPEQEELQLLNNLLTQARQRELGKTSIADLLVASENRSPRAEMAAARAGQST